jgi:hypothetical protein
LKYARFPDVQMHVVHTHFRVQLQNLANDFDVSEEEIKEYLGLGKWQVVNDSFDRPERSQ